MATKRPIEPEPNAETGLERLRKVLSWLAVSIFAASFVTLLVLSATAYWTPGNDLVAFCDNVWRVSGLAAFTLGAIPYLRRIGLQLGRLFGAGG